LGGGGGRADIVAPFFLSLMDGSGCGGGG
jgi:hypothetical protein